MWRKEFAKGIFAILQTNSYYNDKKRRVKVSKGFKENLKKIVKDYFEGKYREELSVFSAIKDEFDEDQLSSEEHRQVQKFLLIFFLGQILDLPTLNSMLEEYEISSNSVSKHYAEIQSKISTKNILRLYERIFEHQLSEHLLTLFEKHPCIFSRNLVTVVLDDSVFKQWLSSFIEGEDFEGCYGKYFSGQTKSSVYGFRVLCLGICIDGVYYPLYFEYVKTKNKSKTSKNEQKSAKSRTKPKNQKSDNQKSDAIIKAEKLVKRFGTFYNKFQKKEQIVASGFCLPALHFSCDNGYSHTDLANCCAANHLIYIISISVPKKSHFFIIDDTAIKLSNWIKEVFIPKEKVYLKEQEKLPKQQRKPFIYRFKGTYRSKKMKVTLIAFRLNGSKRVSIIYSTSSTIFRKTIRRHWFQRTYIEQFFKILKHMLKIQESRTEDKRTFTFKILRFFWMALHVQKLVRFVRKIGKLRYKIQFKNKGFVVIQRHMRRDEQMHHLLQSLISAKCSFSIN